MGTAGIDPREWQSLLHQTNDLVAQVGHARFQKIDRAARSPSLPCLQDYQQFPKVDRNIQQLQVYAGSLRARTNKFRTLNNQIAATRLLAQQGFDASRHVKKHSGNI